MSSGCRFQKAALLTALFIFPASLLRPLGGWLSDKFGARRIMYWVFGSMLLALLLLSAPSGHIVLYVPEKMHAGGPDRNHALCDGAGACSPS